MTEGAREGLVYCFETLIPSLFPFLVLASFVVKSGLSALVSPLANGFTKFFFRLPGNAFMTILLSMCGGYPVGARGIHALYKQKAITENQAIRMAYFAVGAGPAFVVLVIGKALLNDINLGLYIWIIQVICQLLLAFASGLIFGRNDKIDNKTEKRMKASMSGAFVQSVSDGCGGMLNMCAMVILFSAMMGVFEKVGFSALVETRLSSLGLEKGISASLFYIIMEVTGGCAQNAAYGGIPQLLAFAVGWGGLSVHFQVYASLGDIKINKLIFMAFRFAQGLLAAFLTNILLMFYSQTEDAFSTIGKSAIGTGVSATAIGSISLMFMAVCFVLTIGEKITKK